MTTMGTGAVVVVTPGAEATEAARALARQMIAPDGRLLAQQMAALRAASAAAQEAARASQTKARREVWRRLHARGKQGLTDPQAKAKDEARVENQRPSTSELIRLIEAEATLVKDEAMAQRSYQLAALTGPQSAEDEGAYEKFILANGLASDGGG